MGIACAVDLRRPKIKWRRRTGSGACYLNDLGLGASRERQNEKKNITVAQLAGTANAKSRTFNEQTEQRRVADASSADLRLPKARQRDQGRCHPVFLPRFGTVFETRPPVALMLSTVWPFTQQIFRSAFRFFTICLDHSTN